MKKKKILGFFNCAVHICILFVQEWQSGTFVFTCESWILLCVFLSIVRTSNSMVLVENQPSLHSTANLKDAVLNRYMALQHTEAVHRSCLV